MTVENNLYFDVDDTIEPPATKWWHYLAYVTLLFIISYISNIEIAFAADTNSGANAWGDKNVIASWLGNEVSESSEMMAFALEAETAPVVNEPIKEPASNIQIFTISAYYSPVQGQNRYTTGSYAGDIRLNGGGVRGADGTPVYPGMIAAPSTFAFGTKMHIPGIGTVAVHDRGGAIKGNRLDVWMGYGDKGLERALNWGKRTLEVQVYGINPDVAEKVELAGYDESERYVINGGSESVNPETPNTTQTVSQPTVTNNLFSRHLTLGVSGNDVAELQKILKDLRYYEGEISSIFDVATYNAVAKFQLSKSIISTESSYGAGYVGPITSSMLASVTSGIDTAHAKSEEIAMDGIFNSDLKLGDSGSEVIRLQEELRRVHLFGIEPTGYYGELTAHAVFKFQQINKLAGDKDSVGSGIFGPQTRSKLNKIVAARLKITELLALND